MLVELPCSPREVAVLREETTSLQLSLETEIDQFHLEEEREEQEEPVIQVLDSKDKLDRSSNVCTPRFVVAQVDNNSEEEEEMALNKKRDLRELFTNRAKGLAPKDASGSQPPLALLPPPPPTINLFTVANLKKKRKELAEKGELVPQKEPKQQKDTKGKGRAFSVESKEDHIVAEVRPQNPVWEPRLELEGAATLRNSSIKEFQKGYAHYLAEALEQPPLLPKDMAALRNVS